MSPDDMVLEMDMVPGSKDNDLENRFTYHAPKQGQTERYNLLRENAKRLAYLIKHNTQPSTEQSLAYTHLEIAIMFANAAIARNE